MRTHTALLSLVFVGAASPVAEFVGGSFPLCHTERVVFSSPPSPPPFPALSKRHAPAAARALCAARAAAARPSTLPSIPTVRSRLQARAAAPPSDVCVFPISCGRRTAQRAQHARGSRPRALRVCTARAGFTFHTFCRVSFILFKWPLEAAAPQKHTRSPLMQRCHRAAQHKGQGAARPPPVYHLPTTKTLPLVCPAAVLLELAASVPLSTTCNSFFCPQQQTAAGEQRWSRRQPRSHRGVTGGQAG